MQGLRQQLACSEVAVFVVGLWLQLCTMLLLQASSSALQLLQHPLLSWVSTALSAHNSISVHAGRCITSHREGGYHAQTGTKLTQDGGAQCGSHLALPLALHVHTYGLRIWDVALEWNAQLVWLEMSNGAVAIMRRSNQEGSARRPSQVSDVFQMHSSQHRHGPGVLCIQLYRARQG